MMWPKRKSGARITSHKKTNGFSSKLENAVHEILFLRQLSGEISDLKCQQPIVLQDGSRDVRITWRVDFSFIENDELAFAEAKGFPTDVYLLKLKMFRANPQGKLYVYKGSYKNPFVAEIIEKKESSK